MAQNTGTLIGAAIRPNDSLDPIASAFAYEIKGGLHTVSDISDRNAIIFERREWGMMCYVTNQNKTYQLKYAFSSSSIMDNGNWVEFSGSGGSGGSGGGGSEWIDSVKSIQTTPPISPIDGDRYILSNPPLGGWSSLTASLVLTYNSSLSTWMQTIPTKGMSVIVDDQLNSVYKYNGDFPTGNWIKEKLNQLRSVNFTSVNGMDFTATSNPPFSLYETDVVFLSMFDQQNTGMTVSVNINGLGSIDLKKPTQGGLFNPQLGDIQPGLIYSLTYDGTYFQMSRPFVSDDVFSIKYNIQPQDYVIVPQYHQYWVYSDLQVSGTIVNYGHLIVCNGGIVLSGGTVSNFGTINFINFSGTSSITTYNSSSLIQFTQSNTVLGPSVSATIIDGSITQSKLDITNPLSGTSGSLLAWTSSGEFMWVDGSSFGVIGNAEDGSYTDGIFTDFTPSTPIGTAVDRFNEMLLLLAPTPPSSWNGSISSISFTVSPVSARVLGGNTSVSIFSTTMPTLTSVDTVGNQSNAKVDTAGLSFSLYDNGYLLETVTLSGTATPLKSTGSIRHSSSQDPYVGISGKAGFWTGIVDFSLGGTISTTASSSQRTLQLYHPNSASPVSFNYYIDTPLTVGITSITASIPSMTSYVSGVPTLKTTDSITSIGFSMSNVASYFWASSNTFIINAGNVNQIVGDPDSYPSFYGETGKVSGKTTNVASNQFSDLSFSFTIQGRNSIGTYGSTTTFTSNLHRVDTVSSELTRLTSGSGNYPATGYNSTYDSSQSLVGSYTNELQLRNGVYVYPTINYTSVGGPDYSSATGTRWATFNIGTFTNKSAFTLNINGSSGISSIGQANLLIEVKIEGATFWVDGDAAYSGTGNPGSVSDGVAAVVIGLSTATSRRITFGAITYSGSIIVRIGYTGSGPQFTNITATSIS